jgi:hypothetical protein
MKASFNLPSLSGHICASKGRVFLYQFHLGCRRSVPPLAGHIQMLPSTSDYHCCGESVSKAYLMLLETPASAPTARYTERKFQETDFYIQSFKNKNLTKMELNGALGDFLKI